MIIMSSINCIRFRTHGSFDYKTHRNQWCTMGMDISLQARTFPLNMNYGILLSIYNKREFSILYYKEIQIIDYALEYN